MSEYCNKRYGWNGQFSWGSISLSWLQEHTVTRRDKRIWRKIALEMRKEIGLPAGIWGAKQERHYQFVRSRFCVAEPPPWVCIHIRQKDCKIKRISLLQIFGIRDHSPDRSQLYVIWILFIPLQKNFRKPLPINWPKASFVSSFCIFVCLSLFLFVFLSFFSFNKWLVVCSNQGHWGVLTVFIFVFVIVFLLVRSCLLIALITCLKAHKSLGVLYGSASKNVLKSSSHLVSSDKVTYI